MNQNYSSIQERTDLLNKDADKKSIMDSIDRPIRPLVIELNRMGLVTTFSCCGYTYDGQEEPKTHEQKAYVLFKVPVDNKAIDNFFRLSSLVNNFCWGLNVCSNGTEWCIMNHVPEIWKKSDNLPETIHDYEMKLIGITKLTKALKNCPSISEEYTIRDGNETRRDSYGEEWMIVPKKPLTNSSTFSTPRPSTNNPLLNLSTVYTYRKKYMEGENNLCKHCGKDLTKHTAVKKLCPKN